MSVRIPVNPETGHRSLIAPPGRFGTPPPWMDPIVFYNRYAYDGIGMDLWAAGIILYNILTSQRLYMLPHTLLDINYAFFIGAQGLWNPLNEQARARLLNIGEAAQVDDEQSLVLQGIIDRTTAHAQMSRDAIELLENLLREHPAQRFTLAEAMESEFV